MYNSLFFNEISAHEMRYLDGHADLSPLFIQATADTAVTFKTMSFEKRP